MNAAKIRLSPKEMELVINADWILTKNGIIQKTIGLLGQWQQWQQQYLQNADHHLPDEVAGCSPKISKGENYRGLPYLVLDYPRYFDSSGVFAIRTMFWWGHFFSITLHIAGRYKAPYEAAIINAFPLLKENGFSYCINNNEWEHHFEEDNYQTISDEAAFEKGIRSKPFIKLAKKIPLNKWDEAEELLQQSFQQLVKIVTDQLPRR